MLSLLSPAQVVYFCGSTFNEESAEELSACSCLMITDGQEWKSESTLTKRECCNERATHALVIVLERFVPCVR